MNPRLEIDKTTNVAYFDVEEPSGDAVIRVRSASEMLGLKCEILVRVDIKNRVVLGMTIEDYKAFKREMRIKYLAWRIEKLIELLVCRVKNVISSESEAHDGHLLASAG